MPIWAWVILGLLIISVIIVFRHDSKSSKGSGFFDFGDFGDGFGGDDGCD